MTTTLLVRGKLAFVSFSLKDIETLKTKELIGIKDRWIKSKAIINMPITNYKAISRAIRFNYPTDEESPYVLPKLWLVKYLNGSSFVVSPHSFYTSLDDYQVYADISIRLTEPDDSHLGMVTLL